MSAAEDTTLQPAVPHVEYARMKAHYIKRTERLKERAEAAEKALVDLTNLHHRTIVPSLMHDARGGGSWADCPALTCQRTAELVSDAATAWRLCECRVRYESDDMRSAIAACSYREECARRVAAADGNVYEKVEA